jgi:hypothetical protein
MDWATCIDELVHQHFPNAERCVLVEDQLNTHNPAALYEAFEPDKARPDYEPLFSILDGMHQDPDRRFWVEQMEAQGYNCGIEEDTGHMSTGVEIVLQMSHNTLTRAVEYK